MPDEKPCPLSAPSDWRLVNVGSKPSKRAGLPGRVTLKGGRPRRAQSVGRPSQGQGPGWPSASEQNRGTHAIRAGEARSAAGAPCARTRNQGAIATAAQGARCRTRRPTARSGMRVKGPRRRSLQGDRAPAPAAKLRGPYLNQVIDEPVAVCRPPPEGWQRRWSTRAASAFSAGSITSVDPRTTGAEVERLLGVRPPARRAVISPANTACSRARFVPRIASSSFRSPQAQPRPSRAHRTENARRARANRQQRLVGAPRPSSPCAPSPVSRGAERPPGRAHARQAPATSRRVSPGARAPSDSASGPTM